MRRGHARHNARHRQINRTRGRATATRRSWVLGTSASHLVVPFAFANSVGWLKSHAVLSSITDWVQEHLKLSHRTWKSNRYTPIDVTPHFYEMFEISSQLILTFRLMLFVINFLFYSVPVNQLSCWCRNYNYFLDMHYLAYVDATCYTCNQIIGWRKPSESCVRLSIKIPLHSLCKI